MSVAMPKFKIMQKLVDRLKALEMLTALTEEDGDGMAEFLRALNREEG